MIDYKKMRPSTTVDLYGHTVHVKAALFGMVKILLNASGTLEQANASSEIVRDCCTIGGEPIDPDQLHSLDIAKLASAAMEVDTDSRSDFMQPPETSDTPKTE